MKPIGFIRPAAVLAVLLLSSCAKPQLAPMPHTHLPPQDVPRIGSTRPDEAGVIPPKPARPAVVDAMISKAGKQLTQNRPDEAFRTLERALAVDGRDPVIWHLMAKARLAQGHYAQAKSLAGKSNTLAGDDDALRKKNMEIIRRATDGLAASKKTQ